jgi:CRP-like cAMP-binding protein
MKPVEYKNIKISYQDYITYLINLLKYNEIDLINQILKINHYFINIKSIEDFRVIIKGFFIDKINKYLELFNNLTYDDIETLLNAYNLTFEDFKLKKEQVIQDLNDINNNKYKTKDSYDSSSEREKNKKEILTKNMILKGYILNKFCLTIDEKINLSNYSFLFNPKEDNKSNPVTLYKYEYFLYLNPGSFFGDMALETKIRKRNATIRTEEECFILSLSNDDYISLLFEDNKKLKSLDLIFLNSKFFFNDISPVIFDKYYFALFKSLEKVKGDIIYEQETEVSSIYFLREGNVKLELNASIIDIHNLIKFFIDVIEEKNYLHFSSKKIENLRNNYLNDKELLQLRSKNYLYLQKFNEKQKFEISTINKYECLGDLELFLTSGYIHTSTIVSQKASIIEIKKKDLCKIFNEEKDVLPNYYNFVMNKLISQIKRLYYIKNNFINLIKSKIKNNY